MTYQGLILIRSNVSPNDAKHESQDRKTRCYSQSLPDPECQCLVLCNINYFVQLQVSIGIRLVEDALQTFL